MRINITASCRYREYYSLDITEDYLKHFNGWAHNRYPNVEFEDITAEDIYAIFGDGEWLDKFEVILEDNYKLGNFIEDSVREGVWESYKDNEHWYTDDWDTDIEFDTVAEREHFEGAEDDAE